MISRATKTRNPRHLSSTTSHQIEQLLSKPIYNIPLTNSHLHRNFSKQSFNTPIQNHLTTLQTQQSLKNLPSHNQHIKLINPTQNQCFTYTLQHVEIQKKDHANKNRNFVNKIQNINKIHQQINSMLNFVKNGECKPNNKYTKTVSHEKIQNTERSIQNSIRQKPYHYPHDRYYQKQNMQSSTAQIQKPRQQSTPNYPTPSHHHYQPFYPTQTQYPTPQNQPTNPIPYRYNRSTTNPQLLDTKSKKINPLNLNRNNNLSTNKLGNKQWINDTYCNPLMNKYHKYHYREIQDNNTFEEQQISASLTNKYIVNQQRKTKRQENNNQQSSKKLQKRTYSYNFQTDEPYYHPTTLQQAKPQKNDPINNYSHLKLRQQIDQLNPISKKIQQKFISSSSSQQLQKKNSNIDNNFNKSKKYIQLSYQQLKNSKNLSQEKPKPTPKVTTKKKYQKINKLDKLDKYQQKQFQIKVYPCSLQSSIQMNGKQDLYKIIAEQLSEQVKLDQKLRDLRQIFINSSLPDKWKILKQQLQKNGYTFTQQQLQKQLLISPSQSNPFPIQLPSTPNPIQNLVQAYTTAQQFWSNHLTQFIPRSQIQKYQFKAQDLDLDQRGYLIVEDLVCFINLHSANYFRNRDVICLFKRMMAMGDNYNGVEYDTLVEIISDE